MRGAPVTFKLWLSAERTLDRSSVVEKMLLEAYDLGKVFSVVVVDSRPMLEGAFTLLASTRVAHTVI